MLFAMLGGVILNLMPCVFPILSLKALAIAKKSAQNPHFVRMQGLSYTAGVVVSFLVLAGVLIALQLAGQQVGWGYQMQSPHFVLAMTYILFVVGLMLSGVFVLPSLFANAGGGLAAKDNVSGTFFTGVLATLVATPCTAPFMAPALGFALTQSPPVALLVFTSLGFGLALPYLLISFYPPLLRWLPKPGVWMERFKQFLAFPMYGSAAWMLWVLAQQTGEGGLAIALAGIVLVGFFLWVWSAARSKVMKFLALVAMLATVIASFQTMVPSLPLPKSGTDETIKMQHEVYDADALQELLAKERPVFVNATAAWCITCKINERSSLKNSRVRAALAEKGVTYMVADWTNEDPKITALLTQFGRSGVPLYILYAPGQEPKLLPQILTPGIVLDALNALP
jgi:thiol:disulfide interchange protein